MRLLQTLSELWVPAIVLALACQALAIYLTQRLVVKYRGRFSKSRSGTISLHDLRITRRTANTIAMKLDITILIITKILLYSALVFAAVSYLLALLIAKHVV